MEDSLPRRERKKLETRQALLQAASALIREKGYDAATVEEIAERADVAKGTFFNYFPSKEALLGELAVWGVEQIRLALDPSRGAPASPVARIKMAMRLMHEHAPQDRKLTHRAFVAHLCAPTPPHLQDGGPPQARRQLVGLFTDLVGEAQSCGEIRTDIEADLVSDLLHLLFFRRIWACADGAALPPAQSPSSGQMVDLLLDGLAGPAWRQA